MLGVFSRICGICLLLSAMSVVQVQAQRGGSARTPAERRSGNPLNAPVVQPTGTQTGTSTSGAVNPPQPQPGSTGASGTPGRPQPSPNSFPDRNLGFTPRQPAATPQAQNQFGDDADTDTGTGQPANTAGQPRQNGRPINAQPTRPAGRLPVNRPVQSPPAKTTIAAATVTPPPPVSTGFIGPQMPIPMPLPPEKQAPLPPRITFQNGLLTLECTNSRLGDVLNGVRTKANIEFEGLDSAPERVAIKLGPAPADEVLSSLLQGSRFDYVILGQPQSPHTVEKVMLSAKSGAPMSAMENQPALKPQQQPPPEVEEGEATEEQTLEQPPQQPVPVMPTPPPAAAGMQPPGVPTPEELLEKINKLKEEQQRLGNTGAVQPNNTAPLKRPLPH